MANGFLYADMSEMDLYGQLGRKVAVARKSQGMTQADLATRVALTRASIANIETGRQRVMLHDVFALVEALGARSILDFVPERVPRASMTDIAFAGDGASKEDERAMLQMIELATAGTRPRRTK
jgi:transcriptional regulator with XRE-family HTH domain